VRILHYIDIDAERLLATEMPASCADDSRNNERRLARHLGNVPGSDRTRIHFYTGESMNAGDSVFQRALSNMLTEIFDGPPGQEAYVLNPGDSGLLRQLDMIEASAASKRPMPGKTTIAAHVDHLHFGLAILNRWAAGEANPWAGADWNASWQRTTVTDAQWRTLREGLRQEADKWRTIVATRTNWDDMAAAAALSTAAHTAYHFGAIRQILAGLNK
jgi:hypothetical protein